MNNKNSGRNHSFYNEANKSILGQQQITPKRFFSGLFKVLKWSLWLFLIIITLWGCVMNFIIRRSTNLGQGIEFYQNDDFVYPNMYQANTDIVTYMATDSTVSSGIDGKDDPKTYAFDFQIINPNFGRVNKADTSAEDYFDPQVDKVLISAVDNAKVEVDEKGNITSSTKMDSPAAFAYNLNQVTWELTGISNYETVENFVNVGSSLPKAAQDSENNLTTFSDVIFKAVDSDDNDLVSMNDLVDTLSIYDSSINENYFEIKDDKEEEIKKGEITYNFTLKPNETISSVEQLRDLSNYTIIKHIVNDKNDESKNIVDATKFARSYQFLTGEANESSTSITDSFLETDDGKTILDAYGVEKTDLYNYDISAAFKPINGTIIGGSQVVVTQIQRGYPIKASDATKEWINMMRTKNPNYKTLNGVARDSNDNPYGYDGETQNLGFMLMNDDVLVDGTHDILRTYNSAEDAFNSSTLGEELNSDENALITSGTEINVFYGDTRREGWGTPGAGGIFDENVKTMMNNTNYLSNSNSIEINDETFGYKIPTKFAGVSSITQIQTIDDSFIGVLPQVEDGTERSILSDSVIPTGQDSWGENRASFVGWEDWGKAFDIQFGPLYGFVIFPLAQIAMGIGEVFNYLNSPWGTLASIAVVVFLIRGLGALLSLRGTKNQMKMQEVQTEVAKIKAKYAKYDLKKDPRMKQKQQQEIMALYRKHDVNPMGSLGTIFITMPIFISLWIIISALPAYKVVIMGNFSWAISSFSGIFSGGWLLFVYLAVGISVGLIQGISSKLPTWLSNKRNGIKRIDEATKEQQKKQNRTQNIMIGVFVFMGLTTPALFAFYWIMSGLFTIFLELMRHGNKQHKAKLQSEGKIGFFEKSKNGITSKFKK